jgi:hypothetical protein
MTALCHGTRSTHTGTLRHVLGLDGPCEDKNVTVLRLGTRGVTLGALAVPPARQYAGYCVSTQWLWGGGSEYLCERVEAVRLVPLLQQALACARSEVLCVSTRWYWEHS